MQECLAVGKFGKFGSLFVICQTEIIQILLYKATPKNSLVSISLTSKTHAGGRAVYYPLFITEFSANLQAKMLVKS